METIWIQTNETITIELGKCISHEIRAKEKEFIEKLKQIKNEIQELLGTRLSAVAWKEETSCGDSEYRIVARGIELGSGELEMGKFLAVETPRLTQKLMCQKIKEPVFGEEAVWIERKEVESTKKMGYLISSPEDVIITHVERALMEHMHTFIRREQIKQLLVDLQSLAKKEIEEYRIPLGIIQQVIKNFIREGLRIKDYDEFMELLVDATYYYEKPDDITHYIRVRMGQQICEQLKNEDGALAVLLVSEVVEKKIREDIFECEGEYRIQLAPFQEESYIQSLKLREFIKRAEVFELLPLIVVDSPYVRHALARLCQEQRVYASVLSAREIQGKAKITWLGEIK